MNSSIIYGELGILKYDPVEDRIQCHICGKWYIYLFPHLIWKHGLSDDDYREEFGLNRTQPLCTPSLSEKHRRHFIASGLVGKYPHPNLANFPKSHERRLQGRLAFSQARTGVPIRSSEKSREAARLRYHDSLVPQPCVVCGITVMRRKAHTKVAVCDVCRPGYKKQRNRKWADANRERLREYWRNYDLKHGDRHRVPIEAQ